MEEKEKFYIVKVTSILDVESGNQSLVRIKTYDMEGNQIEDEQLFDEDEKLEHNLYDFLEDEGEEFVSKINDVVEEKSSLENDINYVISDYEFNKEDIVDLGNNLINIFRTNKLLKLINLIRVYEEDGRKDLVGVKIKNTKGDILFNIKNQNELDIFNYAMSHIN